MKYILVFIVSLFSLCTFGCDDNSSSMENKVSELYLNSTLNNMISVGGGTFKMGDFGSLVEEKLPYSPNRDDKPLHDIELSPFRISKYKVTYYDYDIYTKNIGKSPLIVSRLWSDDTPKIREDNVPASATWQQAKDYCLWLGKVTGLNVDLPTEAQWEYSARSGGKYLQYPTSNGDLNPGKNFASEEQIENIMGGVVPTYPVGKYPPNSLGIYDIGFNGTEWVSDWYSSSYYSMSNNHKDPTGPETGVKKVLRGLTRGDSMTVLTIYRQSSEIIPGDKSIFNKYGLPPGFTFRRVIN